MDTSRIRDRELEVGIESSKQFGSCQSSKKKSPTLGLLRPIGRAIRLLASLMDMVCICT